MGPEGHSSDTAAFSRPLYPDAVQTLGKYSLCWCGREEQLTVGSPSKGSAGFKRSPEIQPRFPSSCEPSRLLCLEPGQGLLGENSLFSCDSSCALDVVGKKNEKVISCDRAMS